MFIYPGIVRDCLISIIVIGSYHCVSGKFHTANIRERITQLYKLSVLQSTKDALIPHIFLGISSVEKLLDEVLPHLPPLNSAPEMTAFVRL